MSIHTSGAGLSALTQQLLDEWRLTKVSWRDAKCREFDQRYMEELVAGVNAAVVRLQELDRIVTRIKSDCE